MAGIFGSRRNKHTVSEGPTASGYTEIGSGLGQKGTASSLTPAPFPTALKTAPKPVRVAMIDAERIADNTPGMLQLIPMFDLKNRPEAHEPVRRDNHVDNGINLTYRAPTNLFATDVLASNVRHDIENMVHDLKGREGLRYVELRGANAFVAFAAGLLDVLGIAHNAQATAYTPAPARNPIAAPKQTSVHTGSHLQPVPTGGHVASERPTMKPGDVTLSVLAGPRDAAPAQEGSQSQDPKLSYGPNVVPMPVPGGSKPEYDPDYTPTPGGAPQPF